MCQARVAFLMPVSPDARTILLLRFHLCARFATRPAVCAIWLSRNPGGAWSPPMAVPFPRVDSRILPPPPAPAAFGYHVQGEAAVRHLIPLLLLSAVVTMNCS